MHTYLPTYIHTLTCTYPHEADRPRLFRKPPRASHAPHPLPIPRRRRSSNTSKKHPLRGSSPKNRAARQAEARTLDASELSFSGLQIAMQLKRSWRYVDPVIKPHLWKLKGEHKRSSWLTVTSEGPRACSLQAVWSLASRSQPEASVWESGDVSRRLRVRLSPGQGSDLLSHIRLGCGLDFTNLAATTHHSGQLQNTYRPPCSLRYLYRMQL